jgi:hypothetical protein
VGSLSNASFGWLNGNRFNKNKSAKIHAHYQAKAAVHYQAKAAFEGTYLQKRGSGGVVLEVASGGRFSGL